ncbi:MAG: nucleotidyltransferase family protein [Acidimicrobiia bacterium]
MTVAAAILAAGAGSRFDGEVPKVLAGLGGRTLLSRALGAALSSRCAPVVAVVPPAPPDIADAAATQPGVTVLTNPDPARGLSSSLVCAIHHVSGLADVSALCVGLGDQPLLDAAAYDRLIEAHRTGADLAVATYEGRRGHPVLLGRGSWAEAAALGGDRGARALLDTGDPTEVACDGAGRPDDVDTPADLRALGHRS